MALTESGLKKYGPPTATVLHSRVPIFQATRRAKEIVKFYCETPWGSAEITGKLSQVHRDLHDIIMTHGEDYRRTSDGELVITMDPAKIMEYMGVTNQKKFEEWFRDLRNAEVLLRDTNGHMWLLAGIVQVVNTHAVELAGTGGFCGKRWLWTVKLSEAWLKVYDSVIKVRYAQALPMIMSLRSGYSQAIARFFLTHSGHSMLEFREVLKVLGIDREIKFVRRDIKPDLEILESLGITISGDFLIYEQRLGLVSFEKPEKNEL